MRNTIFIVDSSPERKSAFSKVLADGDYMVVSSSTAETALNKVWQGIPDTILVSSDLPGMSGLQFVHFIKNDNRLKHIPIILLSDQLASSSVIAFYREGIDDHISAAMEAAEVLARVRAIMRRSAAWSSGQILEHEGLIIRSEERRVLVKQQDIFLTKKEFDLLHTLFIRPNKVYSIVSLLATVWGYDKEVTTKTVQVHINRLRRKLGPFGARIRNFSKSGYAYSSLQLKARRRAFRGNS